MYRMELPIRKLAPWQVNQKVMLVLHLTFLTVGNLVRSYWNYTPPVVLSELLLGG